MGRAEQCSQAWAPRPVSAELTLHAVFLLPSTGAMNIYDTHKPVKNGLSVAVFGSSEVLSDAMSIARVTSGQPQLKLSNRLPVPKAFAGNLRVFPAEHEAFRRRSKTAAQHIIQGFEIAPPAHIRNEFLRYLVIKSFERVEVSSIDLVDVFQSHDPIYSLLRGSNLNAPTATGHMR